MNHHVTNKREIRPLTKLFSNKCDNCLLSISLENELSIFLSFHVGRCPALRSSFRQRCAFIFTRNPPFVQISMTKCVRLVKVRSSDRSLDVGPCRLQTFAHLNIQLHFSVKCANMLPLIDSLKRSKG